MAAAPARKGAMPWMRISAPVWLVLLSLAALIPLIAFTAYSIEQVGRALRQQDELRVQELAQALSDNTDREIKGMIAVADALAQSKPLADGNFAEFHNQAKEAIRGKQWNVLVLDTALQQLANTRVPFGTALPKTSDPETALRAMAEKRAIVSGLFFGKVARRLVFDVAVPVIENGAARYVLLVAADPQRIGEVLAEQALRRGWHGAISDKQGQIIATSHPDQAKLDLSPLLKNLSDGERAALTTRMAGENSVVSQYRSPLSGWVSTVWAPERMLDAPIAELWRTLVAASLFAIAASAVLAYVFSLPFAKLIRQSLAAVQKIGSGKPLPAVGGFLKEGDEIEASLAEANRQLMLRQRESEEGKALLDTLLENVPEGITIVGGPDLKVIANSKRAIDWIGKPEGELKVGAEAHADAYGVMLPDGGKPTIEQLPLYRASRHGESVSGEQLIVRRPDGRKLRIEVRVNPVRNAAGKIIGAISCWHDVTERHRAMQEITQNERLLRLALSVAQMAIVDRPLTPGATVRVVNGPAVLGLELDGATAEEWSERFLAAIHPFDRARVEETRRRTEAAPGPFSYDFRMTRSDGQIAWMEAKGESIAGEDGAPERVLKTVSDITARKQLEQNLRLVSRELTHRAKNLLTVILGIATQTAGSDARLNEFLHAFSRRIQGLGASHDLLMKSDWAGATLSELLAAQLAPFGGVDGKRIGVTGPEIHLKNDVLQSLGLAFHELGTNAVKYGALSRPSGTVAVDWGIFEKDGQKRLRLSWTERGGPRVKPSKRKGFGQVITVRTLSRMLDGEARLDFNPLGVEWLVEAPLEAILADRADLASG